MEAVPKFARHWIGEEGLRRVEAAVRAAESSSRGEFVPVVVHRSSGEAHVALSAGLCLLAAALAWHALTYTEHWYQFLAEAAGAALAGALLSRLDWVDRLFTPLSDRQTLCFRRARLEFYQHRLEKTKGSTGVLIFVSLADRQAFVLADKSIASKVPASAWEDVVALVIAGIKSGDLAGGLEKGIQKAGEIVRPHFPRRGRNSNELSNRLVVKE